jgi:hypothetical protein
MNNPTLRTLARLLAPWRTIRRLEKENQRLLYKNRLQERKIGIGELVIALQKNTVNEIRKDYDRLRRCSTHGQQPPNAWECPECVRELRQEAEQLRVERDAARVRLLVMNRCFGDTDYLWATRDGMAGPLPPLPEWLAKREQHQGDQEARC